MTYTTQLRSEHDLLLGLADELEAASSGEAPGDFTPLFILLGRFAELLQTHLLREDNMLYPAMLDSRDAEAASVAAVFQEEIGGLATRLEHFEATWTGIEISRRWPDFREEIQGLLEDLRVRIGRENDELYPLMERFPDLAA